MFPVFPLTLKHHQRPPFEAAFSFSQTRNDRMLNKLRKGDPRRSGREIIVERGSEQERRLLEQGFEIVTRLKTRNAPVRPMTTTRREYAA